MKIGVFDSGLGGLTVVDAITKSFGGGKIFYIADTQAAPYGEKSKEQILKHSLEVSRYLIDTHQIDALIVACNSATSAAINELRENFPHLIVIGTEPGIKPAVNSTITNNIGVLATPATLQGEKYQMLVDQVSLNKNVKFHEQECPGLVELIENGKTDSDETFNMLDNWLRPMSDNSVDTIVLGCTHYPLVSSSIKKIMGEKINLIETAEPIAKRLKELSAQNGHKNDGDIKVYVYFTGEININMIDKILYNWEDGGKIMIRGVN